MTASLLGCRFVVLCWRFVLFSCTEEEKGNVKGRKTTLFECFVNLEYYGMQKRRTVRGRGGFSLFFFPIVRHFRTAVRRSQSRSVPAFFPLYAFYKDQPSNDLQNMYFSFSFSLNASLFLFCTVPFNLPSSYKTPPPRSAPELTVVVRIRKKRVLFICVPQRGSVARSLV